MKASGKCPARCRARPAVAADADSRDFGVLVLRDNQITVDPRLPPLEGFGARMAFYQKNGERQGWPRPARRQSDFLEASNQKDGGMVLNVAGTLDATRLRQRIEPSPRCSSWKGRRMAR